MPLPCTCSTYASKQQDLEQQTSDDGAFTVGGPAASGPAPESKLVAMLQSQERQLLGPAAHPESGQTGSKEASAVGGLDQAHAQLMSTVAARQPTLQSKDSAGLASVASYVSTASSHQQAVQQLAARLEAPGADAVRMIMCSGL